MERTPSLRYNSTVGLEFVLRANLNFRKKIKMVAGHLQIKKGYYYAVLSWNSGEKRKTKWVPLGLPEKGNKRKAQVELSKIRSDLLFLSKKLI